MAGDWIKMRSELQSHPKVVRILSATNSDKFRVIGGLHAVWAVFDTHSVDGKLSGYTPATMDHIIGWQGFSEAMVAVGWLLFDGDQTLALPEFGEHNGQSAKRRAEDQKRKRNVRVSSGNDADNLRTESGLDKREDKDKEKSRSDKADRISRSVEIDTWLDSLPEGQDPIPADDPIFDYAKKTGIPFDYLDLAWERFAQDYRSKHKRQKDWPGTFRNAVRGNWGKLWWFSPEGECKLTVAGEQARRAAA